ncbi:hypothetical protein EMIHUDRAFT_362262 [Emiliania huxleyi CCMP1516]|uniref:Uncharacterized protein n=2 Tax=Emiliania huxleyi TaxID=2903 RepID=A0A0D3KN32_EMIH1|nr:hypothetical protein EMIHUDRAFT_362262 [Emiliania huxleyi CCMP1516]EOD37167.1 hypothetical protein EMIHUDRAFT_362262 [Emiliania huxleyi CCMP1516]|eukprot:XP_005789596.1 hypothetical protein EMIHUDRAFT_362262 [Emiliania huxleyi CCMP1516]
MQLHAGEPVDPTVVSTSPGLVKIVTARELPSTASLAQKAMGDVERAASWGLALLQMDEATLAAAWSTQAEAGAAGAASASGVAATQLAAEPASKEDQAQQGPSSAPPLPAAARDPETEPPTGGKRRRIYE